MCVCLGGGGKLAGIGVILTSTKRTEKSNRNQITAILKKKCPRTDLNQQPYFLTLDKRQSISLNIISFINTEKSQSLTKDTLMNMCLIFMKGIILEKKLKKKKK